MEKDVQQELEQIERLADLLDSRFTIPGTNVRFGLDSLVGLLPAVGDAVGLFASLYIVQRLTDLGVSKWVRRRMLANVVADSAVGLVPLAGDVFDLAFKANRRNIALARRHLEKTGKLRTTLDLKAREVTEPPELLPGKR